MENSEKSIKAKLKSISDELKISKYSLKKYRRRLTNSTKKVSPNSTVLENGKTIEQYNRDRRKVDLIILPRDIKTLECKINMLEKNKVFLKKELKASKVAMQQPMFNF